MTKMRPYCKVSNLELPSAVAIVLSPTAGIQDDAASVRLQGYRVRESQTDMLVDRALGPKADQLASLADGLFASFAVPPVNPEGSLPPADTKAGNIVIVFRHKVGYRRRDVWQRAGQMDRTKTDKIGVIVQEANRLLNEQTGITLPAYQR